jgi:hypothetical protein
MTNPAFSRIFCVALFGLLGTVQALACFNEYGYHGTQGNGYDNMYGFEKLPGRHFGKLNVPDSVCANYKDSSDFAVYQLKQGFTGRGLQLLLALSKAHPKEYIVAANLGTAFELAGLNDSALRWIEYSLTLNPDAHEGTEWVHTDILKAKIALAKNPDWLRTHHVLNFDRSKSGLIIFSKQPESLRLREVLRSIYVQLNERLPFTSPGDKIMGDICADAALLIENTSIEVGMAWWKLAAEFGVPEVSANPKARMKLLREQGAKIPAREEVIVYEDENSSKRRPANAHINYLSFIKFNPAKAWKLRDESVLSEVLKELRKPRIPETLKPEAKQITPQQDGVPAWVLLSAASGIILILAVIYFRSKSKI